MNRECEIIDTESAHSLGLETAVATDWLEFIIIRKNSNLFTTQIVSWLCILFLIVTDVSETGARSSYHTYVE